MKIQAMLNPPVANRSTQDSITPTDSPADHTSQHSAASTPKQEKIPKDGFVDIKGEARAEVHYAPHEIRRDIGISPQLDKYNVRPDQSMGQFHEYPRYIPYTSAKKDFQNKTGLKGFNVFQYEFMVHDSENNKPKRHLVLWDYHVGLVRITPFFKALDYSKTTPKKVLDLNPGLADLTVSITGGSLAAQGYWMPFECAKAVAITFCYHIRHLLTPIFGKEFVDLCLHDTDPGYGSFKIDPAIIEACAGDRDSQRPLDRGNTPTSAAGSYSPSPLPDRAAKSAVANPLLPRTLRPREGKLCYASASDHGYGSDYDGGVGSDSNYTSPQVSPKTPLAGKEWTSINSAKRGETPAIGFPVKPVPVVRSPPRSQPAEAPVQGLDALLGETDAAADELCRRPPSKTGGAYHAAQNAPKPGKYYAREFYAANILLELSTKGRMHPSTARALADAAAAPHPSPATLHDHGDRALRSSVVVAAHHKEETVGRPGKLTGRTEADTARATTTTTGRAKRGAEEVLINGESKRQRPSRRASA